VSYVLGLTGSIGMGKSTTAAMFADLGVPVWDADATVHHLYRPGGPAALALGSIFPQVLESDGAVSRPFLRALIATDPTALARIEAIVHPLVAKDRAAFLATQTADIVVLDVPLLYETGLDSACDGVVVVTASAEVQRNRVLSRGEMTAADLDRVLSRQLPDSQKRARATWVIETTTLDSARSDVQRIISEIRQEVTHA